MRLYEIKKLVPTHTVNRDLEFINGLFLPAGTQLKFTHPDHYIVVKDGSLVAIPSQFVDADKAWQDEYEANIARMLSGRRR